jgi:hypothetical protein
MGQDEDRRTWPACRPDLAYGLLMDSVWVIQCFHRHNCPAVRTGRRGTWSLQIYQLLGAAPQFVRADVVAFHRHDLVHHLPSGQQNRRIQYDGVDAVQASEELRIQRDRSTVRCGPSDVTGEGLTAHPGGLRNACCEEALRARMPAAEDQPHGIGSR